MVLDNREVKMKTNREYIQDKLEEKGVPVVKRALDLGDVIWVAKHVETEEEMYLDIVVERKRMDDLVSSLKDGRFREQKVTLSCDLSLSLSDFFFLHLMIVSTQRKCLPQGFLCGGRIQQRSRPKVWCPSNPNGPVLCPSH